MNSLSFLDLLKLLNEWDRHLSRCVWIWRNSLINKCIRFIWEISKQVFDSFAVDLQPSLNADMRIDKLDFDFIVDKLILKSDHFLDQTNDKLLIDPDLSVFLVGHAATRRVSNFLILFVS